jgi:hypothetical protein
MKLHPKPKSFKHGNDGASTDILLANLKAERYQLVAQMRKQMDADPIQHLPDVAILDRCATIQAMIQAVQAVDAADDDVDI